MWRQAVGVIASDMPTEREEKGQMGPYILAGLSWTIHNYVKKRYSLPNIIIYYYYY